MVDEVSKWISEERGEKKKKKEKKKKRKKGGGDIKKRNSLPVFGYTTLGTEGRNHDHSSCKGGKERREKEGTTQETGAFLGNSTPIGQGGPRDGLWALPFSVIGLFQFALTTLGDSHFSPWTQITKSGAGWQHLPLPTGKSFSFSLFSFPLFPVSPLQSHLPSSSVLFCPSPPELTANRVFFGAVFPYFFLQNLSLLHLFFSPSPLHLHLLLLHLLSLSLSSYHRLSSSPNLPISLSLPSVIFIFFLDHSPHSSGRSRPSFRCSLSETPPPPPPSWLPI